ncbi:MAG: hypothetical protein ACOC34_07275 [Thermotogota bacterium]
MSTKMCVILLKDFALLGRKGELVEIERNYAHSYLLPEGIVKQITDRSVAKRLKEKQKDQHRKEQSTLSEQAKARLYRYNEPAATNEGCSIIGKLPPMTFRVHFNHSHMEKIAWEWYPSHRLNRLPAGYKYVILRYKGQKYLATFHFLQQLLLRRIHSPLIIDGSNLGWVKGRPAMDPIFDLYEYIADKSEKFFFPFIWAFDKSFRRKLSKTERRELNEFCTWSGTRIVDYADEEIFKLAKRYHTRYIFSQDHFRQYHTEYFTRISYR